MWAQVDCSLAQVYSQYSMQDLLREFVDLRGIEKSFEHSAFHIVISSFHHILFFVMKAGVPCNSGRTLCICVDQGQQRLQQKVQRE